MKGCFVTGTDTEIGKTWFSTLLVRRLRKRGLRVGVMKPIAAGALQTEEGWRNEDALALIDASGLAWPYSSVNPYCFPAPVSPHIAAAEQGVSIDLSALARGTRVLGAQSDYLVVEGAGGWRAPISQQNSMADLAQVIDLPVILVVGLRLGCLNHAALSWDAIGASGCRPAGWVANRIDPNLLRSEENLATLSQLLGSPPLAVLSHGGHDVSEPCDLEACVDRLMAL